jgi:thiamine biosynthesis lipoprotein
LGWQVSIVNPALEDTEVNLFVEFCGVATASVMDQSYVYRDEVYYNHLDSETGRPARNLSSVTVVAPTSELAAGLARGIFILPPDEGLSLLNDLPSVDGLLINNNGEISLSDSMFIWMGD